MKYTAVYNNEFEWRHYKALFALLDRKPLNPEMPAQSGEPAFFSGNVRSIGDTLSRLKRASIVSEDHDTAVLENVKYELAPP